VTVAGAGTVEIEFGTVVETAVETVAVAVVETVAEAVSSLGQNYLVSLVEPQAETVAGVETVAG